MLMDRFSQGVCPSVLEQIYENHSVDNVNRTASMARSDISGTASSWCYLVFTHLYCGILV